VWGVKLGALLSRAINKIVVDTTAADFEAAFSQALDVAKTAS